MQQARAELHARYNTSWHDWAGVVVYEALPPSLDDQLDLLRYSQARRAMNAALERIDIAVAVERSYHARVGSNALGQRRVAMRWTACRSPGQFAVECIGMRASAQKRLARGGVQSLLERSPITMAAARSRNHTTARAGRLDYGARGRRVCS